MCIRDRVTLFQELEDPYYQAIRSGIERYCMTENLEIRRAFQSDPDYMKMCIRDRPTRVVTAIAAINAKLINFFMIVILLSYFLFLFFFFFLKLAFLKLPLKNTGQM